MFENNLKKIREESSITRKDLAERLNVTQDYLYMIERGTKNPGIFLAKKISDILDKSIEEIFFPNDKN